MRIKTVLIVIALVAIVVFVNSKMEKPERRPGDGEPGRRHFHDPPEPYEAPETDDPEDPEDPAQGNGSDGNEEAGEQTDPSDPPETSSGDNEPPEPPTETKAVLIALGAVYPAARHCLESLCNQDDPYALYGAVFFCRLRRPDDEITKRTERILELAREGIDKHRADFGPIRCREPVELDRIVLTDGTVLVGKVTASSPDVMMVRLPLSEGKKSRTLKTADVKSRSTTTVSAEDLNEVIRIGLCKEFLSHSRAERHVAALGVWGKLCCEFPEKDNLKGENDLLGTREHLKGVKADTLLEKSATWAALTCPRCLGQNSMRCDECLGKGKIKVQRRCPTCVNVVCRFCHQPMPVNLPCPWCRDPSLPPCTHVPPGVICPICTKKACPECKGRGNVRCQACSGSGATPETRKGRWRDRKPCPKCGGTGTLDCKSCTRRAYLCPECKNRRWIVVEIRCPDCRGTGIFPCKCCHGTGKRPGDRAKF